jgi:hypothetical protein
MTLKAECASPTEALKSGAFGDAARRDEARREC